MPPARCGISFQHSIKEFQQLVERHEKDSEKLKNLDEWNEHQRKEWGECLLGSCDCMRAYLVVTRAHEPTWLALIAIARPLAMLL